MSQVEEWLELESDPGLFTMLIENIGVKGVQVEDIYDLTEDIKEEMFGFVFLFKWHEDSKKQKRNQTNESGRMNDSKNIIYETNAEKLKEIYFAHQVIPNSCATNALLSVLMNCHHKIQIGPVLTKLREMTINLTPDKRGAALGNMPELADAHNKRARYLRNEANSGNSTHSPYHSLTASLSGPNTRGLFNESEADTNETYHFVSYVPIGDGLYELDGLQPYPIWHGALEGDKVEDWTKKCLELIRTRMTQQTSEHYSLMGVVRDRRRVLAEQLSILNKNKSVLIQALSQIELTDGGETTNQSLENVLIADTSSCSNSEESQMVKNASVNSKRRSSARVSQRNLKKTTDSDKKNSASNNSSFEDSAISKYSEIISKTPIKSEDISSPSKPISVDTQQQQCPSLNYSTNQSFTETEALAVDTASPASISNNGNGVKYPTRANTRYSNSSITNSITSPANVSGNCSHGLAGPPLSPVQIRQLLQVVEESIKSCRSRMSDEMEKHDKYVTDDIRRSFNYDDFIHAFLFALKKQGLLEKLLDEQRACQLPAYTHHHESLHSLHNAAASGVQHGIHGYKRSGYHRGSSNTANSSCKRLKLASSSCNANNNQSGPIKDEADSHDINFHTNLLEKTPKKLLRNSNNRKSKKL